MRSSRLGPALIVVLLGGLLVVGGAAQAAPTCFGKRATIVGTRGDDTLRGTARPDVIHARGGVDRVLGAGGHDLICLGDGGSEPAELPEVARGGAGDDRIAGADGHDALVGNSGDDRLFGGPGYDTMDGGRGHDRLEDVFGPNGYFVGGPGNDTMLGSDQRDEFSDDLGNDTIEAGDGADQIVLESGGVDQIDAGLGKDLIWVGDSGEPEPVVVNLQQGFVRGDRLGTDNLAGVEDVLAWCQPCDVTGDDGANDLDVLTGVVRGLGGDDELQGHGRLEGGDGSDYIIGSRHDDELIGGAGDDHFVGFEADNLIDGGDGSDTARYSGLPVEVDLQSGRATQSAADRTFTDTLISIENVWGGVRDDRLLGSDTDNLMFGGWPQEGFTTGDDFIDGRAGHDLLDGLDGTDTCVNGEEVRNCEM